MQTFESGATRDSDGDKPDYEGFLSPLVLVRYGEYMVKHRKQADGALRDSDNWQKGIPLKNYIKSALRHIMDVWLEHRGHKTKEGIEEALCAAMFNVMGYLHERLKAKVTVGPPPTVYGPQNPCPFATCTICFPSRSVKVTEAVNNFFARAK